MANQPEIKLDSFGTGAHAMHNAFDTTFGAHVDLYKLVASVAKQQARAQDPQWQARQQEREDLEQRHIDKTRRMGAGADYFNRIAQ